jgi:HEAT repeat protein
MLSPENFIVTFARAVELFRTMPDAVPEQKAALRALVALTKLDAVTIEADSDGLQVAGAPTSTSLPNIPELIVQLREHAVTSIQIDRDAEPAELLALLRGLATYVDDADPLPQGLTVRVAVQTVAPRADPSSASVARAQAEEDRDFTKPEDDVHYFPGLDPGEDQSQSLEAALGALDVAPYEGDILSRLTPVAAAIKELLEQDKLERAMPAVATLVDLEQDAPDEEARRAYGIALLRLFDGNLLDAAADLLMDIRFQGGAAQVLARARAPAFEILHKRLDAAIDVEEARVYARVITPIVDDVRPLLPLLEHQRWPVAESVANILAELAREESVPALAGAMEHADARVRRAAVIALSRIGNKEAVEQLLKAVASDDDSLRSAVTTGVEGRKSSALAMPILKVAESSARPEVRRDCYEALGRIGTPEALQALFAAAEPGGRIVGRKSSEQRVAAINGLRQADDPRTIEKLARFSTDRDKAVRAAAEQAIGEMQARLQTAAGEQHPATD